MTPSLALCKPKPTPEGCWTVSFGISGHLFMNVVPDDLQAWSDYKDYPDGHPIHNTELEDRVEETIRHEKYHFNGAIATLDEAEKVGALEMIYCTESDAKKACTCGNKALQGLRTKWGEYQNAFHLALGVDLLNNTWPPEYAYTVKNHENFWEVFHSDQECSDWLKNLLYYSVPTE